ncbi:hypothetical protein HDU98_001289 [Podochytrium sp. JEL0797]|nr:hypothetical protein HDU98_001289 [Podochytrium sp. JEL0797]
MPAFVAIEKKKDYAIVTLNRGPVNAMNLQFWKELQSALDEIEGNQAMRALIFQSGLDKDIFTAGNDLTELYAPMTSLERYTDFWTTQNVFLANLYVSRLVVVSVIRGACPAGGCAISLASDYRIMSQETGHIVSFKSLSTICVLYSRINRNQLQGLNEPQIGLTVPEFWMELYAKTIGTRQAELLGCNGTVVGPAEAKKIGLVDLLVPKDQLLSTAEAVVAKFLKIPSFGRSLTKQTARQALADKLGNREILKMQSEAGWGFLTAPPTLKAMKATLAKLQGNSAKL